MFNKIIGKLYFRGFVNLFENRVSGLYEKGFSYQQIAKKMGVNHDVIVTIIEHYKFNK